MKRISHSFFFQNVRYYQTETYHFYNFLFEFCTAHVQFKQGKWKIFEFSKTIPISGLALNKTPVLNTP